MSTNKRFWRTAVILFCMTLLITLTLILSASADAPYNSNCGADGDNLTWTLNTHTGVLTISGTGAMKNYSSFSSAPWNSYRSSIKTVKLPAGVTSIGDMAFDDCDSLTSINIPVGVTSIGKYAFSGCSSLISIEIPASVTSIGGSAFCGCSSLTSIELPAGVTSIGSGAFEDCSSLTSIVLPLTWYRLVYFFDSYGYSDSVPSSLKSVTVIEGTTSIDDSAFEDCSSLTSIELPASITSIGSSAFRDCNSLTSIEIPAGVTSISDEAFYNCSSLTSINIPAGVTSIDAYTFYGCNSLTSIELPAGVTSVSNGAFYNCSSLTSIEIPAGVTSIGDYAFYYCDSLTSINIPEGVTSIGEKAFRGCSSLTSIELPAGVTSVSNGAFYNCSSLTSINIPAGVTSIGKEAFSYCSSLTKIAFPVDSKLTSIGGMAFAGCSKLKNVYISDIASWCNISLGNYYANPFYYASNLYLNGELTTELVIPEGVTSIGEYAFYNCDNLTSIEIPTSVTSIGSCAFDACYRLVEVINHSELSITRGSSNYGYLAYYALEVHDGNSKIVNMDDYLFYSAEGGHYLVNYIGDETELILPQSYNDESYMINRYAFYACDSLTSIELPAGVTSIDSYTFYGCSSLTSINIPAGVTSIGDCAFYDCDSFTSINIPAGVTSIGNGAFSGCNKIIQKENGVSYVDKWIIDCDTSVSSVSLRSNTVGIADYAFYDCSSLTSINIPTSVTSIGEEAFSYCSSLTKIAFPVDSKLTSIGDDAFGYCSNLKDVYISDIASWCNIGFGNYYANPFYQASNLYLNGELTTELVIPEGVTSIGKYAFYDCDNLTSIKIPVGVTSIGHRAFSGCSSLTSIEIPTSVTSIGSYVFDACYRLVEVINHSELSITRGSSNYGYLAYYALEVHDGTSKIVNADDYLFYSKGGVHYLVNYVGDEVELVLPQNYTGEGYTINRYAFYDCDSLTSIELPAGVTSMGYRAFYDCDSLTSINIPAGVTSIDSYTFYGCSSLTSIEFPKDSKLTSIGDCAFSYCSSLTSIEIPAGVTSIIGSAFDGSSNLIQKANGVSYVDKWVVDCDTSDTSVSLQSDTVGIADRAFSYCRSLTSIEIPAGVTSIGDYAFSGCGRLTSIEIPKNSKLASIGDEAFYNCSSLTSIDLPAGVTSIGDYAFYYCDSLTSINIPAGVTSIGDCAFLYCDSLEDVYISDIASWCNISFGNNSANPFCYARNLYVNENLTTQIIIPASVTRIDDYAFYDCDNLTSIEIPVGVTSMGYRVFSGCSRLTSIEIPKNSKLTSIGAFAFEGCSSLTSIEFPASVTSIGNYAFAGCSSLKSIEIPADSRLTIITSDAFSYCSSLKSIGIPASVTWIGGSAFYGCSSLTSITFESATTEIYDSANTIYSKATIYGYAGSTAEAYATKYNRTFVELEEPSVAKGTCGENLTWKLTDEGILTISGEGAMSDYSQTSRAPWYSYKSTIKSIVLEEGVTTVGNYAFQGLSAAASVTLPSTLTKIDTSSFASCKALTEVDVPASVENVGSYAFYGCSAMTDIYFRAKETVINVSANTLPANATIHGIAGSKALDYAKKFNRATEEIVISIATGTCGDNATWTLYSNGKLVISGEGEMATYSQSNRAPWYNSYKYKVKALVVEEGITVIGNYAFQGLSVLESVSFPTTLTKIGTSSFASCKALAEVDVPATVTYVGSYAFYGCSAMSDIYFRARETAVNVSDKTLPANATIHCIAGSKALDYAKKFNRDTEEIIISLATGSCGENATWTLYSNGKLVISGEGEMATYSQSNRAPWYSAYKYKVKELVVEEGITVIGNYAFQGLSVLESVSLPTTLTKIGTSSFASCKALAKADIPANVTYVGSYSFYGCSAMSDIYFRARTTAINVSANTIPTNATIHCIAGSKALDYAKKYSRTTEEIIISDGSGTCGDNVTWEVFSDKRLVISGEGAMADYTASNRAPWYNLMHKVKTVVVEDGVTSIGNYAFRGHSYLEHVRLPETLTKIGTSSFANCTALTEADIPASVTTVGSYSFYGCSAMTDITFLSATTTINASANTLPANATIHGYEGSTAETYATKQARTFAALAD